MVASITSPVIPIQVAMRMTMIYGRSYEHMIVCFPKKNVIMTVKFQQYHNNNYINNKTLDIFYRLLFCTNVLLHQ